MRAVINGITMAYDDHGSGPAVVLIHGFPLCRRMWHPQIQALTGAGFRVIAPDLRGFGESDAPEGPYSMELFADDVVELLDHLGIDGAVVGGMSMGGYVLLNLLERYRQRLRGAVFITTRATADDEAGRTRRLQLAQEVLRLGPQVVADAFRTLLFAESSLAERPKLVAEVSRWMAATDSRGLAGGLLAMRERRDYTPLLGGFAIPALAIGAAEDRAAPPETARAIAAGIAGCRLCIVPEAGHLANLEQPGAFNDCLLEFLKSL
ncbi:alpha/beta fold hydrolase [Geobacter sp.]|uniref:alpha/beta fold hydrolase n=1 Tax=Geobacter sp. TaxID=46610 RepID=UPI002622EE63|nr:alpha/beta fold hydrolase [Geobacter sp.]